TRGSKYEEEKVYGEHDSTTSPSASLTRQPPQLPYGELPQFSPPLFAQCAQRAKMHENQLL
ncbi:hypothetical protein HAX54_003316, partial [Datura stramonium]|nr:hypothetical protein [Datura stramonium]